jgi:hypothetical protein
MSSAAATKARSPRISVTPAACMATSVPVPMAMPTSAAARAGASFTPSPTITTAPWPCKLALSSATRSAFWPGSTSAITSSGASPMRWPMARAAARLSPEIMRSCKPRARKAAKGGLGLGLGLVGKGHQGHHLHLGWRSSACRGHRLPEQHRHRGTLRLLLLGGKLQITQRHTELLQPGQAGNGAAVAIHLALQAAPRHGLQGLRRVHAQALLAGGIHHRSCQGVFAAALQAGRHGQSVCSRRILSLRRVSQHLKRHQARPAHGERARLVKSHHARLVGQLQRLRVFDEDAMARRHPGARHDGHRRGQAQRARAGNHQHRHRTNERQLHRLADPPPAQERGQRHQHDHRHKHRRNLVHQALNRRLGGLRVFHQANDAGQHRGRADGRHAHAHLAVAVDAAAREGRAWRLGHGQGLAGKHGLVHLRVALHELAVHRHALARHHHHHIAAQDLGHRHIGRLT